MAIAEGVVEDARVLAATRDITLSLTGPSRAVCRVDDATVTRAVANLVDNAVRYAPDGSAVEVDIRLTDSEAAVAVTDHGPGVPDDEQDRLFERYWRGRPNIPGSGLGLPIAKQTALAHGGTLTVESPGLAGDGSTFTLTLHR